VQRAAATLDLQSGPREARLGSNRLAADVMSDRELSREELLGVVDFVRRTTRHQGRVSEVLGTVEWKTSGQPSEIAVTALPVESGTRIGIVADRSAASAMTWGFSVAGGLVAGAITGAILEPSSILVGAGLLGAGGTAGLGLGAALWARSTRRFRQAFGELTTALTAYLQEGDDGP